MRQNKHSTQMYVVHDNTLLDSLRMRTEPSPEKFSIGGLWVCSGRLDTLKIDKILTDL